LKTYASGSRVRPSTIEHSNSRPFNAILTLGLEYVKTSWGSNISYVEYSVFQLNVFPLFTVVFSITLEFQTHRPSPTLSHPPFSVTGHYRQQTHRSLDLHEQLWIRTGDYGVYKTYWMTTEFIYPIEYMFKIRMWKCFITGSVNVECNKYCFRVSVLWGFELDCCSQVSLHRNRTACDMTVKVISMCVHLMPMNRIWFTACDCDNKPRYLIQLHKYFPYVSFEIIKAVYFKIAEFQISEGRSEIYPRNQIYHNKT